MHPSIPDTSDRSRDGFQRFKELEKSGANLSPLPGALVCCEPAKEMAARVCEAGGLVVVLLVGLVEPVFTAAAASRERRGAGDSAVGSSVGAVSSLPPGREQSGNNRRGQLGVRRGEQLHLGGCPFLHALQSSLDALQFCLSPVDGDANIPDQIRLV
jgi:hypothetical protein